MLNSDPELNLEDVVRGWGFTRSAGSGNEVVRWERVRKYLEELSVVPTSGHDKNVVLFGKENLPEFIFKNIVYKLGFKAKNEVAIAFRNLITVVGIIRCLVCNLIIRRV